MVEIIETERLVLRPLEADDAPALLGLYADPEVVRFMRPALAGEAEERQNIERHRRDHYERYGFGLLGAIHRGSGRFAGRLGLLRSRIGGREETEVSYLLAPEYRGQGLATEGVQSLLNLARTRLGLSRIVAVIHPENVASMRVAERCGLEYAHSVEYRSFGVVQLWVRQSEAAG
jgi:RimJ/RimL family protein N-acetyltransferase